MRVEIGRGMLLFFALAFLASCQAELPPLEKRKWVDWSFKLTDDTLQLRIEKVIPGPISLRFESNKAQLDTLLQKLNPIRMNEADVELFTFANSGLDTSLQRKDFKAFATLGIPEIVKEADTLSWPFPKGRRYKVIQAYNGSFSHNKAASRYTLDFNLKVGDTICAAADGLVMEVIEAYNVGGKDKRYFNYANVITVNQFDGYITQYVHLQQNGAFVEPGDTIKRGQAIGLSGLTGFTAGPHLHFNVFKPQVDGTLSHPAVFEQIAGKNLKKGMVVGH